MESEMNAETSYFINLHRRIKVTEGIKNNSSVTFYILIYISYFRIKGGALI